MLRLLFGLSWALVHVVNLSSRDERIMSSPTPFWQKLRCGSMGSTVSSTAQHEKDLSSVRDAAILSQYNKRNASITDIVSWKFSRNMSNHKAAPPAKKHRSESNRGTLPWLVWGLNCVAAHYNYSLSASTPSSHTRTIFVSDFVAKFSAKHSSRTLGIWEILSHGFTQMPPWRVKCSDVDVCGGDGQLLDPLEVMAALTGCIVGLGRRSTRGAGGVQDCIGVGMIRASNFRDQMLYIVTPLSPSELEKVDRLLVRDSQMNHPALDFCKSTAVGLVSTSPYVCSNGLATEGTGARAIRSRNNILRKLG